MIKSIKFRIKDKNTAKLLDEMARDTNFVWNVLNSASRKKWKESRKYFHKFDPWFNSILTGASKELKINAATIQAIRDQFHKNIRQHKKQLRFRGKKSPRWIPFKKGSIKLFGDKVKYDGNVFKIWNSFKIKGEIKSGCFTRNTVGKWFVSFSYESIEAKKSLGAEETGIDLGLKTTATCSNGKSLNLKDLDLIDKKIGNQQRARNFKRSKVLNIKKTNLRIDKINKFALDLVKTNSLIAIGNVQGYTKGKFAKSRYQNSWSLLKNKLEKKCLEYEVTYLEVGEHLTTQTCNECGSVEGPKGIKELGVRNWICSCGARLNRDENAATNILFRAKCLAS